MMKKAFLEAGALVAFSMAACLLAFPSGAAAQPVPAGQSFRDCDEGCPEMVAIPTGSFTMGSADPVSGPPRQVTIAKPFAAGKFEVTYAEFDVCVAAKACVYKRDPRWGKGKQPLVNVSWDEAKEYTAWLSRKTGKPYRLLTEAEWEFAARAGTTTPYFWGNEIGEGNANCQGCGGQWNGKQPAPVGSFKPNPFGLHDMNGNVWEWVEDCWEYGFAGAPGDGSARNSVCADNDERVMRGGAFLHEPEALRATVRNNYSRNSRANGLGFRVARAL